ncbi:CHAD domain-containing protein [Janthinobacterium sp. CG_23.3]|uniref:CYTH and CHAD domain-containing protein n=1 Tax=Janthinobacterium sp. CG_23.3 TaxID=3349634 RepID=UPI0038D4EABA
MRSPNVAEHLYPIFTNTTHRTIWNLDLPDGQQVECSLDSGNIDCRGQNLPIEELEFELKKGNPTQLFDLALALHRDIPLELSNDSKAARGYAMLENRPPEPVKAGRVKLLPKMSLENAFRCMGFNCLQQMEANMPGVLNQSVESLHQMRVGLRRLRALLDMFEPLAKLPPEVRVSLDWLAGELGATRDWDVLATSTLDEINTPNQGRLVALATTQARSLHQTLVLSLHEPRYTELLLQLNGWFHGRAWRKEEHLSKKSALAKRAVDGMTPLLKKAEKRLISRVNSANQHDASARHRVRIAAKKARYAAEFFSDLLPNKAVKHYISALSQLQDRLGSLNDLEVAKTLLSGITEPSSTQDGALAIGYIGLKLQQNTKGLASLFRTTGRLRMASYK